MNSDNSYLINLNRFQEYHNHMECAFVVRNLSDIIPQKLGWNNDDLFTRYKLQLNIEEKRKYIKY